MPRHQTHPRPPSPRPPLPLSPTRPPPPSPLLARHGRQPLKRAIGLALAGGVAAVSGWAGPAPAQTPQEAPAASGQAEPAEQRSYRIPAGPLDSVLMRFLAESGVLLSGSMSLAQGRSSPGLQGSFTPAAALEALLAGTGLAAVADAQGRFVLRPAASDVAPGPSSSRTPTLASVLVTAPPVRADGLSAPFAGAQVARGARLGMLGDTDLRDTPFNVSSYTAELMENQQARSVADVLANDPSVREAATASAPGQYLLIRGFVSMEASISFNGLAGMAPYIRGSTQMAERVELIKGPSAAINGMLPDGSIGGSVMMVPKRAGDAPLTRVGVDFGSRSQFGTHVDVGRRFGENKAWGIRVNGVALGGEGNIKGRDQSTGLASLALDYRGERLRAAVDAYWQRDRRDGTDYYVGFLGRPSPVPDASKPLTRGDSATARDSMTMARVEYDLTSQLTAFAAFGRHAYRSHWIYANPAQVDERGDGVFYNGSYRLDADLRSAEAGLRAQLKTGPVSHRLTLAATEFKRITYYGSLWGDDLPGNIFNPVTISNPGEPGSPPESERNRLRSIALTDTLGFWDERLLLTLGVRHQQVHTASVWTDAPYKSSAWSPLAAVVFKPTNAISLYANYVQGLSQGPVAPIDAQPPLDNAGEVFPPYKSQQYELGIKGEWGSIGSSLSLFQIAQPNSLTVGNHFTVDGEQRNRGLEWNVYGAVRQGVRVLGGITLVNARVTKAEGETQGRKAFGVPSRQLNLGGEWDLPGLHGLTVSGRAIHTSSVPIDSANQYTIPSWTRWDLGARYVTRIAGKPVALRANLDNVFDKGYWMGYRQGWMSGMVSRSAPRTLLLSATVDF